MILLNDAIQDYRDRQHTQEVQARRRRQKKIYIIAYELARAGEIILRALNSAWRAIHRREG